MWLRKAGSNLNKLLIRSYKDQSTHCMHLQYISHQTANDAVAFGSYFPLCSQKVIYNLKAGFISLLSDSANAGLFFLYTSSMLKRSKIIKRGENVVNLIHQNCSCLNLRYFAHFLAFYMFELLSINSLLCSGPCRPVYRSNGCPLKVSLSACTHLRAMFGPMAFCCGKSSR